jgi:hypothetical protein
LYQRHLHQVVLHLQSKGSQGTFFSQDIKQVGEEEFQKLLGDIEGKVLPFGAVCVLQYPVVFKFNAKSQELHVDGCYVVDHGDGHYGDERVVQNMNDRTLYNTLQQVLQPPPVRNDFNTPEKNIILHLE